MLRHKQPFPSYASRSSYLGGVLHLNHSRVGGTSTLVLDVLDDDGFICCFFCTPLPVSVSHFLQSAVFVGSWVSAERFSILSLDFWNNLIARVHRWVCSWVQQQNWGSGSTLVLCSLLHLIALGSFWCGYLSSTHVDFGILDFSVVVGFIPRFFVAFASSIFGHLYGCSFPAHLLLSLLALLDKVQHLLLKHVCTCLHKLLPGRLDSSNWSFWRNRRLVASCYFCFLL